MKDMTYGARAQFILLQTWHPCARHLAAINHPPVSIYSLSRMYIALVN